MKNRGFNLHIVLRHLLAVAMLLAVTGLPSSGRSATFLKLDFDPPGATNEFQPTPALRWTAEAGVLYQIQASTNIADSAAWRTVDVVQPEASGLIRIQPDDSWDYATAPEQRTHFFRLLTQPYIFDVQPAFIDSSSTNTTLYIRGQLLPTDALVVINGHTFVATNDGSGNLLILSLTGLPPGEPIIGTLSVLDAATSNVVATITVQSPILYGTALTTEQLQGPAQEPLSSPMALMAAWLSKKGYDYYKAHSDLAAAGLQNNPYFAQNQNAGEMPSVDRHRPTASDPFPDPPNCCGYSLRRQPGNSAGCVPCDLDGTVFLASGEVQFEETDLAIPGAMLDFAWTRTYRSRTGPTTVHGAGWDFSYNVSLTQNGDGTLTLRSGNGRADTFYPNGAGKWTRDEYFCEIGDLNGDGMPDVLFADTGKWLFNPLGTPAGGKLWQIIDRNGNTMTLNYDTVGRLTQIVGDLGRTNSIGYDSSSRIASVTDFSGRTVGYEYNTAGDLISVISPPVTGTPTGNDFPGGITNRYTYSSGFANAAENHLLLSVIDGKGQMKYDHVYQHNQTDLEFLHCVSVQNGANPPMQFTYVALTPTPSNGFAMTKVIMRDAEGNVSESFYDSRQRCVRLLEYTGRAPDLFLPTTETLNRPVDKLRADDPDFYEKTWSWNRDSLCALETLPDGERTRMTYESDVNPTAGARKKGDCRVVREYASGPVDLDGDGLSDITERAWHFDYDPNFGSPGMAAGRGIVITKPGSTGGTASGRARGIVTTKPGSGSTGGTTKGRTKGIITVKAGGGSTGGWPLVVPAHGTGGSFRGPRQTVSLDGSFSAGNVDRFGRPAINTALNSAARAINTKGTGATVRRCGDQKVNQTAGELCDDVCRNGYESNGYGLNGYDLNGFCVSATDPRGSVTTASYDSNGNCKGYSRKNGAILAADYNYRYNSHGQLTAVTNAPDANGYRRVDAIGYYSSGPQNGWPQSVVTDTAGLQLTENFEYDSRGNLTRYVDPRTNDWLFTYNALDQCVTRQTPNNSFGSLVRTMSVFGHDANGNTVSSSTELRDENDNFLRNALTLAEYDALDRCITISNQVSPGVFVMKKFFWTSTGRLAAVQSPLAVSGADPHATVAYEYDERGMLFHEIDAPGSGIGGTNEWSYDANGNLRRVKAELYCEPIEFEIKGSWARSESPGRQVHLPQYSGVARDGFGRPVTITDGMSNVVSCVFDRNDNLTLVRLFGETNDVPGNAGNLLLAESSYAYDGLDRVTQSRDKHATVVGQTIGDGYRTTTFAYAPNDALTSVTDDNGHPTSFGYDTVGRAVLATAPGARTVMACLRDAAGNVTRVTQTDASDLGGTQAFTVDYTYDALNRCVQSVDNVGNTNRWVYDSLSRVVNSIAPNGNVISNSFDDLSRLVSFTIAQSSTLAVIPNHRYGYNDNSQCIFITDANTNTTSFVRDSLGRVIETDNADGTRTSLVWSPRSNLLRLQDPNGNVISNRYDALDRLVARDISPGPSVANTTTLERYAYDGMSRLTAATNDVSFMVIGWDTLGNPGPKNQDGAVTSFTYDGVGNRLSMTYPSGLVVSYGYNAVDDVTNVTTSRGGQLPVVQATIDFEGPGRIGRISRANGVNTRVFWDGISGTPNVNGDFGWRQVSGVNHQVAGGGAVIDRRVAKFDRNQNRISREQVSPFYAGGHTRTNTMAYDALDRMTSFSTVKPTEITDVYTFTLDTVGNRQTVTSNGVPQDYFMDATPLPGPADFQMSQYTVTPFGAQTNDDNGNLLSRTSSAAQMTYEYDYADRLVSVAVDDGTGSAVPVATYAYDALSHRVSKTVYSASPIDPPVTTTFVYGKSKEVCGNGIVDMQVGEVCDDPILETRVNGVVGQSFVLDGTRSQDDQVVRIPAGGSAQYFHQDDLGNVLALTGSGGSVLERYDYGDFGQPQFLTTDGIPMSTNSSPVGNPFLFRGLEWDGETGFYHQSQGDHFDPQTARGINGISAMPNRISMNVTVPKQTQGATFGEKVNAGLHATGGALAQGASLCGGNNPWSGGGSADNARVKRRPEDYLTGHVTLIK